MRATVLGGYAGLTSTGAGASGYLFQHGDTSIVVDLGPGTLAELRRGADLRDLDAVVVSHGHLDHVSDLVGLHHVLRYSPTPLHRPIPLLVPPGATRQFDLWGEAMPGWDGEALEISEYDPTVDLTVGEVTIRFRPTVHPLQGWAMRFSAPGAGSIGYTADTGPTADLDDLFAGVEVLFAEATLIEEDEPAATRGHLTAAEAGELAARTGCSTLVLTHRWEESDGPTLIAEAGRAFKGTIALATPGLTVDATSRRV
jgi:ribonuclease BN (tRNA processing enzyme)